VGLTVNFLVPNSLIVHVNVTVAGMQNVIISVVRILLRNSKATGFASNCKYLAVSLRQAASSQRRVSRHFHAHACVCYFFFTVRTWNQICYSELSSAY
jgi:hypothetical protein